MNNFILYSTPGCHLCNDALEILNDLHNQMRELANCSNFKLLNDSVFTIDVVDVADKDILVEVYGARIPVLVFPSSKDELAWPFDIQAAYQFILPKLTYPQE